jgi:hypothetical protein
MNKYSHAFILYVMQCKASKHSFVCVYFVYIVLFQNCDENNIVIELFILKQIGEFASSHSFDTKILDLQMPNKLVVLHIVSIIP